MSSPDVFLLFRVCLRASRFRGGISSDAVNVVRPAESFARRCGRGSIALLAVVNSPGMSSFFDLREKVMQPAKPKPANGDAPLSVAAVTKLVDKAIRGQTPASLVVRGEVSQFSHNRASGHAYFTLKDAEASLPCVMFREAFER